MKREIKKYFFDIMVSINSINDYHRIIQFVKTQTAYNAVFDPEKWGLRGKNGIF